jgi:hypothetical protein
MKLSVNHTTANSCVVYLQFMDFCKNYRELRSMGFPKATVAGALLVHKNDFEAATEACLAAQ